MAISNKGQVNAMFNRVSNPIKPTLKTPSPSAEIEELKKVNTYVKPNKVHSIGYYHDSKRSEHHVVRIGELFIEIPKTVWRWNKTELKQWVQYVDTLCKIVLSENGYCNYKVVIDFMKNNNVKNLDNNVTRQVISWWSSSPSVINNRKTVVKNVDNINTVKHNHTHYGYESTYKGTNKTREIMKMVSEDW